MFAVTATLDQEHIDQGILDIFEMGEGDKQSFAGVFVEEIKPVGDILTKGSGNISKFSYFFRNMHWKNSNILLF